MDYWEVCHFLFFFQMKITVFSMKAEMFSKLLTPLSMLLGRFK